MKNRYYWLLALLGLFTYSCTQEEIIPEKQEAKKIEFSSYVHTKAALSGMDSLRARGFNVTAAFTGDDDMSSTARMDFLRDEHVTYNPTSSNWEYANTKFWPASPTEKISFFALAGFASYIVFNNYVGYPSFNYIIPDNHEDQVDVAAAVLTDVQRPAVGEKVIFDFEHVFSAIVFEMKTDYTQGDIILNRVTIDLTELYNSGEFVYGDTFADSDWTLGTSKFTNSSDVLFNGDLTLNTTDFQPVITNDLDNFLIVMPQNIPDNTVRVRFKFSIQKPGEPLETGYVAEEYIPADNLTKGTMHFYQITLYVQDILDNNYSVQFGSTTVSDWNQSTVEYPTN